MLLSHINSLIVVLTLIYRFNSILADVALLHSLGVKIVLVLGCSVKIDEIIRNRGGEPQYVADGKKPPGGGVVKNESNTYSTSTVHPLSFNRITDKVALLAAKEAAGEVGVRVMAALNREASLPLVRRHGQDRPHPRAINGNFTYAMRFGVVGGIDYMFTGKVRGIDRVSIQQQLNMGNIVILSNLGYSPAGEVRQRKQDSINYYSQKESSAVFEDLRGN